MTDIAQYHEDINLPKEHMKHITTFVMTATLFAVTTPVMAAGPAILNNTSATPTLMQRLEDRWNKTCDNLESRIDIRITRYENNAARHKAVHQRVRDKVKAIIDKLDAKGIDTTKLKSDLKELDIKIQKFATDYSSYIEALKATKNYACGESEGQFVKALSDANKYLSTLQRDSLDIRSYYQKTIRADIAAIRDQLKKDAAN